MIVKLLKKGLIIFIIFFNSNLSFSQKYHNVKKGETLFSISKIYKISLDSLILINGLSNHNLSIDQKIIVESKSVIDNDTSNSIKSLTLKEEGFASTIENETSTNKYLALHKSAKVGTIIFIKNQMNDNMVIVRVIGKLPDTGDNKNVNIKLSAAAFDKLNPVDKIIPIEMTYVLEEKKN
ncbi:MAG: LysM peptidoglycan-binding domain-containing protein [Flammeovirgaceae bacterium TMED290]|nr:MAG: LysM peptidoglycan-binding domain-containing protein [Flammeovirgaceae bacterium TMED290]|tara:strand:+ start:6751 stop:7290 length:540 start_codon:yes stop_codon:yes gene_type:complete